MDAPGGNGGGPRERAPMRLPANQLSALRLALIPVLWVLAVGERPAAAGAVLVLAALTDVADGIAARTTHTVTRFGSALDSVADHLLAASTAGCLVLLRPDFVREQLVPLGAWALLGLATLAYGWVRHRRIGNLHLYSAKLAGVVAYAFAATLFFFPGYSRTFFGTALVLAFVGAGETLLVLATRARADERTGSILLPPPPDAPPRRHPAE